MGIYQHKTLTSIRFSDNPAIAKLREQLGIARIVNRAHASRYSAVAIFRDIINHQAFVRHNTEALRRQSKDSWVRLC